MKKICVIFTGGTIGSFSSGKTVDLMRENKSPLIAQYRAQYQSDVQFDEFRPLNVLSENIQFSDLETMSECVRMVKNHYDGIIITHGTDTLCFTANLFSQIFCDCPIPIVFVSALYPLGDKRSRGVENFAGAVDFICQADCGGVFVSFRNEGENLKIHLASRMIYADQISGNFQSVLGVPFGEVVDGKFLYTEHPMNPSMAELRQRREPYGEYRLCKNIITIRARSFLDFSLYNFGQVRPRAVIIELYHSGTVCTAGEETNALNFVDYCHNSGVEVVLAPIDSSANVYASTRGILEKCILGYDISFEMTVVKAMLALGSGKPIGEELQTNRFFEKLR